MTALPPPTYYFNGITFNSAFYNSSSSGGLTQAQANALYLQKTTADTATVLETFSGGINTTAVDVTSTGTLALGNLRSTGVNIGVGNAGTINIGGANTTSIALTGVATTSGSLTSSGTVRGSSIIAPSHDSPAGTTTLTIGGTNATGTINVGGSGINPTINLKSTSIYVGGASGATVDSYAATAFNIGTSTATAVNIGANGYNTTIKGNLLTLSTIDTTLIGSNYNFLSSLTTGSLSIASGQTNGSLNIGNGTGRSSVGGINIGTGSTAVVPIAIGGSASNTTIGGNATIQGNLQANSNIYTPVGVDSISLGGTLRFGNNLENGSIIIGPSLTTGSISIGASAGRTGDINIGTAGTGANTINVGSSTTTTTINGVLSVVGSETDSGAFTATGLITANGGLTMGTGKILKLTGKIQRLSARLQGIGMNALALAPTVPTPMSKSRG